MPLGVYGLRVVGFPSTGAGLMGEASERDPAMTIEHLRVVGEDRPLFIGADRASGSMLWQSDFVVTRDPLTFLVRCPLELSVSDLLHPFLAPAAALAAWWRGYPALHAAAVVINDRAWVVLGPKESGKSTTVMTLNMLGHPILADDLVVLRDDTALAGPRSIDLREESAERFRAVGAHSRATFRDRSRVELDAVAPSYPLGGFVCLAWGDLAITPLSPSARIQRLLANLMFGLTPGDGTAMLRLATLPFWDFSRPRDFDGIWTSQRLLVDHLSSVAY